MTEEELIVQETLPEGEQLEVIETMEVLEDTSNPFLTTPFEDYTVTEGLLLTILMVAFIMFCINVVKGGFSWLWS
jgi:hypothetical protein